MSLTSLEAKQGDLSQVQGSFNRAQLLALDKLNALLLESAPLESLQLTLLQQLCQVFDVTRCWLLSQADLEYDNYRFVAISGVAGDCSEDTLISHSPFASHYYLRALRAKSAPRYFGPTDSANEPAPSAPFSALAQCHFKINLGTDCAYVLGVERASGFSSMDVQQLTLISQRIGNAFGQNAALQQSRNFFLDSPIAACYVDISRLRSVLHRLSIAGAEDLSQRIAQQPNILALLWEKVRISRLNTAALTLFDASSELDLITHLPYLVNESLTQAFVEGLVALIEGEGASVQVQVKTLRGRKLHLVLAFSKAQCQAEQGRYLTLSMVDVTARVLAAQQQREHQVLAEQSKAYWQLNIATGLLECSPSWYEMRARSEPCERLATWYDAVLIDDLPRVSAQLRSLIAAEQERVVLECRVVAGLGAMQWLQLSALIKEDESGTRYLCCTELDITEQKQLQERLKLSATVFDNTIEGIVIVDASNKIIEVNPAFSEIIGYSHRELIGQSPMLWRSDRQGYSFYRTIKKSLHQRGKWSGEIWNKRKDGQVVPQWLAVSCVYDERGKLSHHVGVFSDISELKKSQAQLQHMAHYDHLTDLPNRYLLGQRIDAAIEQAKRTGLNIAVCYLDLDNFKHYNDSLGHAFGDKLLQQVALNLISSVRSQDTISRIGGDEFIILLNDLRSVEQVGPAIEKVISVINRPFVLDEQEARITASVGVALYPDDGDNSQALISNADAAMYRAKSMGRNNFQFYSREMTDHSMQRILLSRDIHRAINGDELLLHFQPQVSLQSGEVVGVEALIRWQHPELGFLSPDKFIPLAEESSLIAKIGSWVLHNACYHIALWRSQGLAFGKLAINVAVVHLSQPSFVSEVIALLKRYQIPPETLEIEITESSLMQQVDEVVGSLQSLRQLGVDVSIDDFGTGYSSLSYLTKLPINKLKIDRSFITDILDREEDLAIAETIIAMGDKLGLTVIAEGIETAEQCALLTRSQCHHGQGFLFSKPLAKAEFERYLRQQSSALTLR
ncbi:MAG: sensor domain-containing protein [Pseudomonadales bacterium]